MNKLTLTAAVTALGLMLTGCATTSADSAGSELIKHLRGEKVSAAETVLDADAVGFWSPYSDEELLVLADKACALVDETVAKGIEAGTSAKDALVTGLISSAMKATEGSENPEDLKSALNTLAMVESAVTVYCQTHREDTLAAILFLEAGSANMEEGSADGDAASTLSEIEQLNLDLASFVAKVTDVDGNVQSGVAITFGDDGRTVNLYSDLNGDNVIEEAEILSTFVAPEGYIVTYEATGEYLVGEAYGAESKVNVASLKVVKE
jgi:hypothetical protein